MRGYCGSGEGHTESASEAGVHLGGLELLHHVLELLQADVAVARGVVLLVRVRGESCGHVQSRPETVRGKDESKRASHTHTHTEREAKNGGKE